MRHPKNSKRSGGKRWQAPPLTGHALKIWLKHEREKDQREFEEYEKRWRKSCEETSVED